jgi:UDP-N-acetylmuramate--alanine ligase
MGIPCISRAELLGAIIDKYDFSVGVIGTHGKSTVSAMIYRIFSENGSDAGAFIGASGKNVPPFSMGDGSLLVYEGCEYGDSFLHFEPSVNLVLSVDYDHTDYFPNREAYRSSFLRAARLSRKFTVINASDPGARSMIEEISGDAISYAKENGYDYKYSLENRCGTYSVCIFKGDEKILSYRLSVPGEYNAKNSVAAAVLTYSIGISPDIISKALERFCGIGRRLEKIGVINGAPVYYDYAHHPTEIDTLAQSLADMGYSKIAVVFAPHTYTRTRDFMESMALALSKFSITLITEIYGARELPIVGVSSSALAEKICGFNAKSLSVTQKEAIKILRSADFDCLALVGAGDLDIIKKEIEEW